MRPEAMAWWKPAEADRDAAEKNAQGGTYFAAAFLCHQASEKALKAVHIERLRGLPAKTHNLIELGRAVQAPEGVVRRLRTLNPEYVASRYPDAANGVPAENYDEEKTRTILEAMEAVCQWAASELTGKGSASSSGE